MVRAKYSYLQSFNKCFLSIYSMYARLCSRCLLCSEEQDSVVPTQGETGIKYFINSSKITIVVSTR